MSSIYVPASARLRNVTCSYVLVRNYFSRSVCFGTGTGRGGVQRNFRLGLARFCAFRAGYAPCRRAPRRLAAWQHGFSTCTVLYSFRTVLHSTAVGARASARRFLFLKTPSVSATWRSAPAPFCHGVHLLPAGPPSPSAACCRPCSGGYEACRSCNARNF